MHLPKLLRRTALCASVALLAACAHAPSGRTSATDATPTAPMASNASIDALQQRLHALDQAGASSHNYALAKAQCWLDSANLAFQARDRSGYVEAAMAQSAELTATLEADPKANAGSNTPLIAGSHRLREDLWARLLQQTREPGFACAAATVACAEVQLVHAGHADERSGPSAAAHDLAGVEEALTRADSEALACAGDQAPQAMASASGVLTPPAPDTLGDATFTLQTDDLFPYGSARLAAEVDEPESPLMVVAHDLAGHPRIPLLTIVAHTDRLGANAYRKRLSRARAAAVHAFLLAHGVRADHVRHVDKGSSEPIATACEDALPRAKLVACLSPDRRFDIEATGVASP